MDDGHRGGAALRRSQAEEHRGNGGSQKEAAGAVKGRALRVSGSQLHHSANSVRYLEDVTVQHSLIVQDRG